uniref:Uncharacterized protein n=1 Tax=Canis lupus familiaris TaxID=9615 RepID=A0A8P0PPU8_CANLF
VDVNGKFTADGKEVLGYLSNPANYPVSIRSGRPRLTSNEKLMLASMFHSLNTCSLGSCISCGPTSQLCTGLFMEALGP